MGTVRFDRLLDQVLTSLAVSINLRLVSHRSRSSQLTTHADPSRRPTQTTSIVCAAPALVEVGRNRGDHCALAEQEAGLEQQRALIVEELIPPVVHYELGNDDRDDVVTPAAI